MRVNTTKGRAGPTIVEHHLPAAWLEHPGPLPAPACHAASPSRSPPTRGTSAKLGMVSKKRDLAKKPRSVWPRGASLIMYPPRQPTVVHALVRARPVCCARVVVRPIPLEGGLGGLYPCLCAVRVGSGGRAVLRCGRWSTPVSQQSGIVSTGDMRCDLHHPCAILTRTWHGTRWCGGVNMLQLDASPVIVCNM